MQKMFFLVMSLFVLTACNERKKEAKAFEAALEAASPGQTFTIVKLKTEKANYTVYRNENTGEYIAYNMDKWDRETMTTLEQYNAVAVAGDVVGNLAQNKVWVESGYWEDIYDRRTYTDEYWDDFCECWETETWTEEIWIGERWVDTSHWYTFYTGGGFRFENTAGASKDLETIAALKEDAAKAFMKAQLKSQLKLSESRASEMASLASKFQKLENARELTDSEKDQFAMKALGVSMKEVESALKKKAEGSEALYESVLKKAAQVNNTTPESIGLFFDEVL